MSKPIYYPGIYESVRMLFVYQAIFYFIPLTIITILFNRIGLADESQIIETISVTCAFIFLLLWLRKQYCLNLNPYLRITGLRLRYLCPMTFLILGADIVISELSNIMQGVFPIDPNIGDALMGLFNPEKGYFNSFLLVVILAPLFEEIVFRGFIFRGLLAAYSPQKAGLISSVLFGAFHMNIWQFPGTVIWGIIASWWFFQTGSLLYCIYGHLFMNGVGFVAMILKYQYQIVIPGFSSDYYQATAQPSWFTIMGIMFFVTGVFILFRMFHRHNNCPSGR